MKRFTETTKWDDEWYMSLSPTAKHVWQFLLDHCDNSGVVELNAKLAAFQIGEPVEPHHLVELGDRVETLPSGKLWIRKFIKFQFGNLSAGSLVHQSVIKLAQSHSLPIAYPMLSHVARDMGCLSHKDKDKEKEKEKEKEKDPEGDARGRFQKPTIEAVKLQCAKIGLPETEAGKFISYHESKGWVVGRAPMKSWAAALQTWKSNFGKWGGVNGRNPNRKMTDAEILEEACQ